MGSSLLRIGSGTGFAFGVLAVLVLKIAAAEIAPAKDAPQPLPPLESAAKLRLPAGFHVELVASEPLIHDPSCITFDEQGRLFVCELHGYNLEGHLDVVELNKAGVLDTQVRRIRWERVGGKIAEEARRNQYGTVKLLTDSDSDGQMDTVEVWADRIPTCYGIVPARGGIIVVCAPDILYLADHDGDGKAEVQEILYTGFHFELLERGINNPRWGMDNWIYVGAGGGGGEIHGPHLEHPVQLGNSDFRIKADGTAIEPVNGVVRTYGMTLNDVGDRFPSNGGQPATYALPLPYRYLKRNPHVPTPKTNQVAVDYNRGFRISQPHPWRVKRQQDPEWVKFYGKHETNSNYFTGGCGGEIYRAELFPEPYRGNFFYCEPSLNIIHRCVVQRDGAGYQGHRAAGEEMQEFMASTDGWFRPINLRVGPYGELYVVDMYREIIEDYSAIPRFLQQQYGVIKGNDKGRIWRVQTDTTTWRPVESLAEWSSEQLVEALSRKNSWWQQTAQRVLIERGAVSATRPLSELVVQGQSRSARLHALYTLQGLERLKASDVINALDDTDYGVRLHALQLAEPWLDSDPFVNGKVLALANDPDARVRLQLAMTLGESQHPSATDTLISLAVRFGSERWMAAAILSSVRDSAGQVLVGLLSAEGQQEKSQPLLSPLAATSAAQDGKAELQAILDLLVHQEPAVQVETLSGLVAGLSREVAVEATSLGAWNSLKQMLGSSARDVHAVALKLATQLGLGERPEVQMAFTVAAREALDVDRPLEQREAAIQRLADASYATLAPVTESLLDARQPPALQLAAIETFAAQDDAHVVATLLQGWKSLTPQIRGAVLEAVFARDDRLSDLLDAIENGVIQLRDINALRREQLTKSQYEDVAERATTLLAEPDADAEFQRRANRYQQALAAKTNSKRGQEVFAKHCLACHQVNKEGHEVGPPLGSVINKPDEAILLDILDPSRHIESDFTSYLVVTHQGLTFTGILASDSATSVTLRKDKGASETILRKDIEVMEASQLSLMPSNLYEQINPQDMANLIAYLREVFGKK